MLSATTMPGGTDRNDVDDRIDRLTAALAARGYPRPEPAPEGTDDVLAQIDAAVAPLRLPEQARRLWRRVTPFSLALVAFPQLAAPDFALRTWRSHMTTVPVMVPERLFPLCYTNWSHTFVELHTADADDGGALFNWAYGGMDFSLSYDDVADWLDVQLDALAAGDVEEVGGRLMIPWQGHLALHERRVARRGLHPAWGSTTEVAERPVSGWPGRWR